MVTSRFPIGILYEMDYSLGILVEQAQPPSHEPSIGWTGVKSSGVLRIGKYLTD